MDKVMRGLYCCSEDGNCLKCPYYEVFEGFKCTIELSRDALERIEELEAKLAKKETPPAVDAVPVTRCKDCYHFMEYTPTYSAVCGFDGACRVYRGHTTGGREGRMNDDFCSRGKPL